MLELKDGFVLYHGSYCEVKEPDLAKCAKRKDFGQGFYLTTSKEQAESFLRTSIVKAIATGTIEEGQKYGFVLYHGSYCEVKEPDLAKCAKRKDFGQGFYLTTSKEQAESFLRTSIVKAIATGTIEEGQKYGYISTFEFKLSENLETHIFENADVDWLHCIAAHRKKKMFIEVEREMARYDIIAGKIADDATNATLTAYLAGVFGTAGDKEADDFCIRQLLPNKLKDQYCFKTEAAIRCLKFVKGEKIWLR